MSFSNYRLFPYLLLFIGVIIAATSSILIRLAQANGAPSLVIASWRLTLSVIILSPLAWGRQHREFRRLSRRDVGWGIAAGVFLAAHMATWVSSLEYTSVASSAALVTTNPLWVALIVFLFFRERLSRQTIGGLAAALSGSILVAFSDGGVMNLAASGLQFNWQNLLAPVGKADTALWGDLLALGGAITASGYLLIGRSLRTRLSNTAYVWIAYSAAMVALIIITLLAKIPLFGYTWQAYLWVLLVALGPQLLGHTIFNWALAHLSATFVALTILGEPVGSAIFAYFLFDEGFAPLQLVGFALLLSGISLGILGERKPKPKPNITR